MIFNHHSDFYSISLQITISGSADSVALAKSLINMSLDIHKSKLEDGGGGRDGGRDNGRGDHRDHRDQRYSES